MSGLSVPTSPIWKPTLGVSVGITNSTDPSLELWSGTRSSSKLMGASNESSTRRRKEDDQKLAGADPLLVIRMVKRRETLPGA